MQVPRKAAPKLIRCAPVRCCSTSLGGTASEPVPDTQVWRRPLVFVEFLLDAGISGHLPAWPCAHLKANGTGDHAHDHCDDNDDDHELLVAAAARRRLLRAHAVLPRTGDGVLLWARPAPRALRGPLLPLRARLIPRERPVLAPALLLEFLHVLLAVLAPARPLGLERAVLAPAWRALGLCLLFPPLLRRRRFSCLVPPKGPCQAAASGLCLLDTPELGGAHSGVCWISSLQPPETNGRKLPILT
mmetsp:Transcript_105459/g.298020  ORF Transcript_105459/g.298020 Transcript_105459/m.298020 type:complete len:245 (+) Transcript_105459:229-963(+)